MGCRFPWLNCSGASCGLGVALALSIPTLALRIAAQPTAPLEPSLAPVQLEYAAPAECEQYEQFVARVQQRSDRIEFDASAPRQLVIAVQGSDANFTGRASFAQAGQRPVAREITARSCEEVVDGLALVTVMVLDPEALQRASPDAPSASEPSVAALPSTAPAAPKPPSPQPPALTPPATRRHAQYELDAVLAVNSGPAPRILFGWGAAARVEWVRPGAVLSPQLRLILAHFAQHGDAATSGQANFILNQATLGICPVAVPTSPLRVHPCLAATLGRLTATGTRTFVPATEELLWADVGVQLEVAWQPLHNIQLFAIPALGIALKRYSFSFTPYQFYTEPPVVVSGTAGLGVQFE